MKGEITINGKDAWTEWGLSLTDGALAALMTPAPAKDYLSNASRLEAGTRYIADSSVNIPPTDEREITLPIHFTANNKETFLTRYKAFCEILKDRKIDLYVAATSETYHLLYKSCTSYTHIFGGIAKFSLKVVEPDPTNRS